MKNRTLLIVSIILYTLCILLATKAKAQNIGINPTGATPNASAGLDIDFTNKGLLIPRVALTATNSASPLTSPATSVLVYNTATAGSGTTAVVPGYYFWNGSAWNILQTNGGSGSIWSRTPGNVFLTNTSDNIGIGISSPLDRLHIASGNVRLDPSVFITNQNGEHMLGNNGSMPELSDATLNAFQINIPAQNSSSGFYFKANGPSNDAFWSGSGLLGLGTINPTERLHIGSGKVRIDPTVFIVDQNGLHIIGNNGSMPEMSDATLNAFQINIPAQNSSSGFYFKANGPSNDAFWTGSGLLGLGTVNPTERLHIGSGKVRIDPTVFIVDQNGQHIIGNNGSMPEMSDATLNAFQINIPAQNSSSGFYFKANGPSNDAFWTGSGLLGLGNVNPTERLDVSGKTKTQMLQVTTGATSGYVLTSDASGNATWQATASATATAWGLTGNTGTTAGTNFVGTTDAKDLVFKTAATERMRILSTGNVGIGNTAPAYKLDVLGSVRTGANGTDGQLLLYSEQGVTDWTYTINPNAAATQNVTLTLPTDDGNANQVLTTDGSGNLSWTSPSASAWGLTGNSGTSATTNFIGTTDSIAMIFKVNNHAAGRIGLINATDGNTSFGGNSLRSNTSGNYNNAFGSQALQKNTTGANNTAFGTFSMMANVSGGGNAAFGDYTLQLSTSNYNSAFGNTAMSYNTTGNSNVGVGNSALQQNHAGSENAAVGTGALMNFTYDPGSAFISANTAMGSDALLNTNSTSTSNGINNTVIGYSAGLSNTTGFNNTYLGYSAGGSATIDNSTAIGANSSVTISDAIVLGGTGANGVSVGIGTTAPSVRLDIRSNIAKATTTGFNNYFEIGTNDGAAPLALLMGLKTDATVGNRYASIEVDDSGTKRPLVLQPGAGGYVGIGTTAPAEKLAVSGSESAVHGKNACISLTNTAAGSGGNAWYFRAGASGTATPAGGFSIADNSNYWFTIAQTTGNVGIATTAANSAFEVNGAVAMKVKTALVAGTTNPDNTGEIWLYTSGTGAITLPGAGTCANRIYVILNNTGGARTISSYKDLTASAQITIGANVALWIVSDGTNWQQIK